jgi:hypothetical protein
VFAALRLGRCRAAFVFEFETLADPIDPTDSIGGARE